MNFRSYSDLSAAISRWQEDLPRDLTLICGLPRSGLMVAHLVALQWNLPVTDPASLLAGRVLGGGRRLGMDEGTLSSLLEKPQRILVVEDSVAGGEGIRKARAQLNQLSGRHRIQYAAVYVAPEGADQVDFAAEIVPMPRVFEWNLFHHSILGKACVDIDGVLCRDPSDDENDDGSNYRKFLRTAPLRHQPSEPIGWLVSSRLEKYRADTEAWLQRHGIRYGELMLLDLPDMQTRRATGAGAAFKAEQYRRTGARLFIESESGQAVKIAAAAGREVLATDVMQLIHPGTQPNQVRNVTLMGRSSLFVARKWPRRVARLWRRCSQLKLLP